MLIEIKMCYYDLDLKRDVSAGELFDYQDEKRAKTLIEAGVAREPKIEKVEAKKAPKPKKDVKADE